MHIGRLVQGCWIRHDFLKHERELKHVICRDYCEPCLKVIEDGKCSYIKEMIQIGKKILL